MRIQELEQKAGLERATIRFYEREHLLTPKRTENGYREYSEEDAAQLLKIKLLRQLGMSVDKIRQLQQGSADFSQAMEAQIRQLSSQIEEQKRARTICQTMQTDGVDYQTLDAAYYLKLLREFPTEERFPRKREFRENIPKEIHPWRRYFARTIDLALFSTLVQLVLFVIFRIRPLPNDFVQKLLGIACGFLYVPLEALLLHKLGTTPGKWAMGIRLEWIQGGNLPYSEALSRSWRVLKYGMAFGIPYVQLFFNLYRYGQLTGTSFRRWRRYDDPIDPPMEMDWDDETEFIYDYWEGKSAIRLVIPVLIYTLLFSATVLDMVKPAHRTNELTIAQFAENYNCTMQLLNSDGAYDPMQPDGTIAEPELSGAVVVITLGGDLVDEDRKDLVYETEDGILRCIRWENAWENVFYLQPHAGLCQNAAFTALMSQPDFSLWDLYQFEKIWETHLDEDKAAFRYKNIEVQWELAGKNVYNSSGTFFTNNDNDPSEVSFQFELRILPE